MRTGRPSILTPEFILQYCTLLKQGHHAGPAAQSLGVHPRRVYDWIARGAAGDGGIYEEFSDAVLRSQAEAEVEDLNRINKAANEGNIRAIEWKMERRYPDRWGQKVHVEVKEQLGRELLERLREKLDPSEFGKVAHALLGDGSDSGIDSNNDD